MSEHADGKQDYARRLRRIEGKIRRLPGTVGLVERLEHLIEHMRVQQRQFVTDASHELRTPLAGLRLWLEEARLHPDQTDLGELIGHTMREVERLQNIISDLLLLARLDSDSCSAPVPIDVADLVEGTVSERADALPIDLHLERGLFVGGVTGTLARLLGNLLDNAERHGRTKVRVTATGQDDQVVLAVDDDGPGIPPDERERVFELFTRTDSARSRDHGRTGLGLTIALSIADAHSGTLTAHASDLGGARLELRLPLLPLATLVDTAV
ncbi:sensor histidine kinase [Nonomuraea sp. KM90]|uniref:sensor histidine kinase n=1 Tax=Nonomuraea sp. KM90 TaxID=3457428 RepID=UPI003FCD9E1E